MDGKGNREDFEAWSNVDFNYLTGFGNFEFEGLEYNLIMGIGNMDTDRWRQLADEGRFKFEPPQIPTLPPGRVSYLITRGDAQNMEAERMMRGLHELYRNEKERLIEAYQGRERARIERAAYLKAHPPKPEDITLQFFRGKPSDRKEVVR